MHTDTEIAPERSALGVGVPKNFPVEKSEIEQIVDRRGRIERWEQEVGEAAEVIFHRVSDGETLKAICRSRKWPYSLVAKWVSETPEVLKQYEMALRLWADALATETVDLADQTDPTEVNHGKLRVDTRMKLAARLDRARYGDKVEVSGTVNHAHSLIGILSGMGAEPAPEKDVTPLPTVTEEDPI